MRQKIGCETPRGTMKRGIWIGSLTLIAITLGLLNYLFRPLLRYPEPATLRCAGEARGRIAPLEEPRRIYGLGLSYAGHIAESPGLWEPGQPPVFEKRKRSINRSNQLPYPDRRALFEAAARVDPEHAEALDAKVGPIDPLLDYEVEIGLVVLEPIERKSLTDPDFAPPLGFFVANDITARILIGMAPDFVSTVDYLAEGKGLAGFLPLGDRQWTPLQPGVDLWPCVELITEVNGDTRQRSPSSDIIAGPREILLAVAESFGLMGFEPGDWVLTGTPGGVAMQTPGWIQRGLALLDPNAATKVAAMSENAASGRFLSPGDEVVVRAGFLGESRVRVVAVEPD